MPEDIDMLDEEYVEMFAPPEQTPPTTRFWEALKKARAKKSCLTGFGAYTGDMAGLLTLQEVDICYGSGWNWAAKQRLPDMGLYSSHEMVDRWAREVELAIDFTRDYVYEQSGGKKILNSPFLMVDLEAGFGDEKATYMLAYKLFRQTDAVIAHIENQVPDVRVCGHAIEFNIDGRRRKEPKVVVPRNEWLNKLKAAQLAANVAASRRQYATPTRPPAPGLILARTDSADGVTRDGKRTTLQDAIDDIIAAHEEAGILLGWVEFNNCGIEDPLKVADQVLTRCPAMLGLAFNVSPNLYKEPHEVRSKPLAEAGYVIQFSTIPANLVVQREMLQFGDEFKKEPFEAVLKLHERAKAQGVYERDNGIFKNQTWPGMDWWRKLKMLLTLKAGS